MPWSLQDTAVATGIVFAALVAFLLVLGVASALMDESQRSQVFPWLAAASEAVLLYAVWAFGVGKHGAGWDLLGLRRPVLRWNWWLAPAALLGSMAVIGLYAAATSALGFERLLPAPIPDELLAGGAIRRALIAVTVATWVPFAEELFFRGFLLQGVASRHGLVWGVVVSAALFSAAHMMLSTAVPIFAIGLILGFVYVKSRSLWVPIAAHSAQNLIAVLVAS